MRLTRSRQIPTVIILVSLLYLGCGGSTLLKSFRVALTSAGPLVSSLVSSGVIPQTKADAILRDFSDSADCGLALQNAFAAIPKDLPAGEIRQRKFQASSTALQCFQVIINRQNFAANPRVQNISAIARGVLESLVIFYSPSQTAMTHSADVVLASDEDDLEKQLKAKVDEINRLLKVP